jgi:hypothetical protein
LAGGPPEGGAPALRFPAAEAMLLLLLLLLL